MLRKGNLFCVHHTVLAVDVLIFDVLVLSLVLSTVTCRPVALIFDRCFRTCSYHSMAIKGGRTNRVTHRPIEQHLKPWPHMYAPVEAAMSRCFTNAAVSSSCDGNTVASALTSLRYSIDITAGAKDLSTLTFRARGSDLNIELCSHNHYGSNAEHYH